MRRCFFLAAACVGCVGVDADLTRAPLLISSEFSTKQIAVIESAVAEWVTATDGRFCPGDDCAPTIADVEPYDAWSIVEVPEDWPFLGSDTDKGRHTTFYTSLGAVKHDAIVLVRGRWGRRTVLHEIGHRLGLEHGDGVPIMRPSRKGRADCLTASDLELFCERAGCEGHEGKGSCVSQSFD